MGKIICDVCGTSYPETASQCPICGCVRLGDVNTISAETAEDIGSESSYTYIKGGRFSKNNVRKRNAGETISRSESPKKSTAADNNNSNTGLIVIALVLLLAIVGIVIYIGAQIFQGSNSSMDKPNDSTSQNIQQDDDTTQHDDDQNVPCTDITVGTTSLTFTEAGQTDMIQVTRLPEDTTDTVSFLSLDTQIVTVEETTGIVTAVATGETVIRVQCGEITRDCLVFCVFESEEDPSDDPTDDTTEDPTDDTDAQTPPVADGVYHIDNLTTTYGPYETDITLSISAPFQPTLQLVDENGNAVKASWTAQNDSICGISVSEDGLTVAFSHKNVSGSTNVTATYGGKSYTCIVRVTY